MNKKTKGLSFSQAIKQKAIQFSIGSFTILKLKRPVIPAFPYSFKKIISIAILAKASRALPALRCARPSF